MAIEQPAGMRNLALDYRKGRKRALIDAVLLCAKQNSPIPPWVRNGLAMHNEVLSAALERANLGARFDREVGAWIDRAESGRDPGATMALLGRFANDVAASAVPDPAILRFLAKAFSEHLDRPGSDIGKALGLVRVGRGKPKGRSKPRSMTPGDRDEIRAEALRMYAEGRSDGEIKRTLGNREIRPAIAAQKVGPDTVRDMLRELRATVIARRDEFRARGIPGYEIPELLGRELDMDTRLMECVLLRITKDPGPQDEGAAEAKVAFDAAVNARVAEILERREAESKSKK